MTFKTKNIIFFSSHSNLYGSQLYLLDLIPKLIEKGYKCSVLTSFDGPFNKELSANLIQNTTLELPENLKKIFTKNPLKLFTNIFSALFLFPIYIYKLRKIIKQTKINLLYTNNLRSHFLGSIAALFLKTKTIFHVHGTKKRSFLLFFTASIFADKIILLSKNAENYFRKFLFFNNKLHVIYNGIDVEYFENQILKNKNDCITLGFIGSITPKKGLLYAIKAMPEILTINQKIKFNIYGEKPKEDSSSYFNKLQREIRKHNLKGQIVFCGYNNIHSALNNIDILIVPSLSEPFGRVIIEAMAMKTPVIATNRGGVPEIITHNYNGYLVEPKNEKQIALAVKKLLAEDNSALITNAAITAKNKFSINTMIDSVNNLVSSII